MSLKLYYQNSENNFGDLLSKDIVSYLSHKHVVWSHLKYADIVALGSLSERVIAKKFKRYLLNIGKPLNVWGTGFLGPGDLSSTRFLKIHALRGEYSKARFDLKTSVPLGDPGFLTPLVYPSKPRKSNTIICLPHLHDYYSHLWVDKIKKNYNNHNVVTISLSEPVINIVNSIAGAEFIVSSAMHPLIVAQSYGTPFIWVELGNLVHKGCRYKFEDCFSVLTKNILSCSLEELFSLDSKEFIKKALESSIVYEDEVKKIQQDLQFVFPEK